MSSSIPPNALSSVAQARLSESQRAREAAAADEADARQILHADRKRADNREFVQDMVEAKGLRVDPQGRRDRARRRKRAPLELADPPETSAPLDPADRDRRARSAALLADPAQDGSAPPPLMLDIEA